MPLMIKTKVIQNRLLPGGNFLAITLFGLVFTHDKRRIDKYILNHELIHCQQQLEWLYLPFFLLYGVEWLYHLLRLRIDTGIWSWHRAYRAISFEREAYDNDHDLSYLRHRRHYANYRN